ncbi:hypothetical protein BT69DRAFT_1289209 [Atractiella rhizophila]|nr:hypothetical protein BT69DRAFT_1289209 [Atractiella rhizophila]
MGKRKHREIESAAVEQPEKTKTSSFLLPNSAVIDQDLDDIFSKSLGPAKPREVVEQPRPEEPELAEDEEAENSDENDEDDAENSGEEDEDDASAGEVASDGDEDMADEAEVSEDEQLVHESVARQNRKPKSAEEKDLENSRTIFVGNVPVEVSKQRSLQKPLIRHLLSYLPSSIPSASVKVQSMRFRSVAFSSSIFGRRSEVTEEELEGVSRSRKRAKLWKVEQGEEKAELKDETEGRGNGRALTEMEKRKIAFVKGEVNANSKACNAYVVFADRNAEVDGEGKDVTAQDVVRELVKNANGSVFMDRTLVVDSLSKEKKKVDTDELRRTIYVGNLDFAEDEEKLRKSLEAKLKEEMGAPEDGGYVQRVRIVRDRKTGLGKGFAYVVFQSSNCVDELMGMDEGTVKSSKRKLRFERCKSEPRLKAMKALKAKEGKRPQIETAKEETSTHKTKSKAQDSSSASKAKPDKKPKPISAPTAPPSKPTPRPDVGAQLAKLSKEERKKVKGEDAGRIARRMEKKKLKIAKALDEKKFKVDATALGKAKGKFKKTVGDAKIKPSNPKKSKVSKS